MLRKFKRKFKFWRSDGRKTLGQIFSGSSDIKLEEFESLLLALDAESIEKRTNGDGWCLNLNGVSKKIEAPPHGMPISRGTINATKVFLTTASVTPETVRDFLGRP